MRILMMGTGPFAVPTLEAMPASGHDVVGVITRPTLPAKGRRKAPPNPMRDSARQLNLDVYAPDSINSDEAHRLIRQLQPELMVVCDYGQILSAETLALSTLGGINLHGSLLPMYRGAAPINWALYNADKETGVTVIHMTPKLDSGPCLVKATLPVDDEDDAESLEIKLSQLGIESVMKSIELLSSWDRETILGEIQDQSKATKAPRLKKADGEVDWNRSAQQIRNQVRAFKPWPGTFTHWLRPAGEPVRLIFDVVAVAAEQPAGEPGSVVVSDGERLLVATGNECLSLQSIKPAGKRVMKIQEFLRGHLVQVGDQLGPHSLLSR